MPLVGVPGLSAPGDLPWRLAFAALTPCAFFRPPQRSDLFVGAPLHTGASLVAHLVKNPPAMQETRIQLLDQDDPLEKELATRSSIFAWEVSRTEKPAVHGVHKNWTRLSD